jgi:hypothetical protein
MDQPIPVNQIAHLIQLAIAPVFLLAGIGAAQRGRLAAGAGGGPGSRHCEERSDEAIQWAEVRVSDVRWIASLRSQ